MASDEIGLSALVSKVEQLVKEGAPVLLLDGAPGKKIANRSFQEIDVTPELPEVTEVETLGGLVDLCENLIVEGGESKHVVIVKNPRAVSVESSTLDEFGRRVTWFEAQIPAALVEFPFGKFLDHESFYIAVMSLFASYEDDRDYVLQMASSISAGETISTSDDGITQQAVLQSGAALKAAVTLRARVKLSPFRTFRDATQPTSEFVFRVRKNDKNQVELALFESDGGAWRIRAMENIKTYLTNALKSQGRGGIAVIA